MIGPKWSDLLWLPAIFAWGYSIELIHWLMH